MPYTTYKNTYSKIGSLILTNVTVLHNGLSCPTVALWDTGASKTHVSEDILDALGIESFGEINAISHRGSSRVKKYLTSIKLPTGHIVENLTVISGNYFKINDNEVGVLIGMDIISCGDFHIDNTGERTIFTFRLSSNKDKLIETNLF